MFGAGYMMAGRGFGMHRCGLGIFVVFLLVVLLATVIYMIIKMNKINKSEPLKVDIKNNVADVMQILNERLAKGEITDEEYLAKKELLTK